ncbi:MAG TPA: alpha/beta hydrolase [Acidimicrobiales bacterium]|nr:alpha/beta hydrolase [Acidimicrobiales bacterium]
MPPPPALAVDDVGDPDGAPVLYLHGTPDSRLSRHPDDGLAAAAGVRLLAVDRPGYGASPPLPVGTDAAWPDAVAAAVAATLDDCGVAGPCGVLAWSGGALAGVALGALLADRVAALGIVGGLAPRQAYDDPAVRAAGAGRLGVIELADALPPGELGEAVAPLVAPYPCDLALAADHQAEQRDPAGTAELATVPGAAERLAVGLVEAVRPGLAGVAADIEAQARPLAVDLGRVACPVRLWYGEHDTVTPPAFGEWYTAHLPDATLEVVPGAAHYLALTRWADLLRAVAPVGA